MDTRLVRSNDTSDATSTGGRPGRSPAVEEVRNPATVLFVKNFVEPRSRWPSLRAG
jgi:hypothetical protein